MSRRHITRKILVKFLESPPPPEVTPAEGDASGGPFAVGSRVSKYRLIRLLGKGGMGWVYEAEDTELHRGIALKILKREWAGAGVTQRFQREATIAAKLQHPNIVPIYDFGIVESQGGERIHFMAMALVKGLPLSDLIASGTLSRPALLRILEDIAQATAHAHANGVIHRDLKPANVMVNADGRALLTDFGLAHAEVFETQITKTASIMGTPFYMAPEQVLGKTREIDARTDVYALGVMLFECLAGRVPYGGTTPAEVYRRILGDEAPRLGRTTAKVHADLELVCMKAMERRAADRYSGAAAFADDLARFRRGEPVAAKPASIATRMGRLFRRRRTLAVSAALAVAVLATASAVFFIPRMNRQREEIAEKDRQLIAGAMKSANTLLESLFYARRHGDLARVKIHADQLGRDCEALMTGVPSAPEPYLIRGRLRRALMKWEESLADLDEAVRRRPDFVSALYERVLVTSSICHDMNRARLTESLLEGLSPLHHAESTLLPEPAGLKAIRDGIQRDVSLLLTPGKRLEDLPRGGIAFIRAMAAWTTGSTKEAREGYMTALAENPALIETYDQLIRLESDRDAQDEVIALATRAIEQDPGYSSPWNWRACALKLKAAGLASKVEAIGMLTSSIADFGRSLALRPANTSILVHRAHGHFILASLLEQTGGDPGKERILGLEDIRESFRISPDDGHRLALAGHLKSMGEWAQRCGRDPRVHLEEAVPLLEEVISHRPHLDFPHHWLGSVHHTLGGHAESLGADPSPHFDIALRELGVALDLSPDYDRARLLRASLRLDMARRTRGGDTVRLEFLADAIRDLTVLLESKETPEARQRRGSAFLLQGRTRLKSPASLNDLDAAIRDFDHFLKGTTTHLQSLKDRAQALFLRAGKEWEAGNDRPDLNDRCLGEYASLAAAHPQNYEIQSTRGFACGVMAQQRHRQGRDVIRECTAALEAFAMAIKLKGDTRDDPKLGSLIRWCEKYLAEHPPQDR